MSICRSPERRRKSCRCRWCNRLFLRCLSADVSYRPENDLADLPIIAHRFTAVPQRPVYGCLGLNGESALFSLYQLLPAPDMLLYSEMVARPDREQSVLGDEESPLGSVNPDTPLARGCPRDYMLPCCVKKTPARVELQPHCYTARAKIPALCA
jgi:hypothetical protein